MEVVLFRSADRSGLNLIFFYVYDLGFFYYLLINFSFCFYMIFVLYREGSFYIDNSANRI
jgi:hypothetical protein